MFWPSKRREQYFENVRVNDRVQMDIAGRSYLTRVEDVLDQEVHVAAPLEPEWTEDAQSHDRVILNVFSESGFLRFSTRITRLLNNRVPMVTLAYVKDLGSLDRRQHDRVAAEMPIRYRIKAGPDHAAPWSSATTSDVSGSGLRAVCDSLSGLRINDYLDIQLLLPSEDQPLKAVAQVVWATPMSRSERKPCFGAHFVIIQQPDQARIVRFVKNRIEWVQKLRREYDRAPAELPVRYRWQVPDGWTHWRHTMTTDVSGNDIRLVGERPGGRPGDLHVGDQVEVQLSLPDDHKPIIASGRVARLASGLKAEDPGLAMQFDSIDEQERKRIIRYVHERRSQLKKLRSGDER
ncbi:MAG: flagellar brake protein [Armatimonadota bacterium]|nr:flagellar brake protein [Armatimonadota bacterium]